MNIKQIQPLIDKFNEQFPVGSPVLWRPVSMDRVEFQEYKVKSPAYNLNGQPVVFLEGRNSCCSIEPGFVKYEN